MPPFPLFFQAIHVIPPLYARIFPYLVFLAPTSNGSRPLVCLNGPEVLSHLLTPHNLDTTIPIFDINIFYHTPFFYFYLQLLSLCSAPNDVLPSSYTISSG